MYENNLHISTKRLMAYQIVLSGVRGDYKSSKLVGIYSSLRIYLIPETRWKQREYAGGTVCLWSVQRVALSCFTMFIYTSSFLLEGFRDWPKLFRWIRILIGLGSDPQKRKLEFKFLFIKIKDKINQFAAAFFSWYRDSIEPLLAPDQIKCS